MKKKNVFKTGFKIPSTVKFQHKQNLLFLKGPIGSVCLSISFFKNRTASLTSKKIKASSFYRLLQKAIVGVFLGFVVRLAFVGVGFRVESIENSFIKLKLGFSHFVFVKIPPYILVLLKEFCSKICFFRVPDVYKGKGILYKNQQLTLKEGKKK
jgi:large subunit ribosomal protein L6